MKKLFLGLFSIITLTLLGANPVSATANDFYFSDSTFDYYLSREADGASLMRVEEVLTAEFPANQNHGIERCLPKNYRGVEALDISTFNVTHNGATESFSSYINGPMYCFRIGSASAYVNGTQTYAISYVYRNVILDPEDSENQELYWDTNGTGWSQYFYSLTATVHLSEDLIPAFTGDTSCYVGEEGASGVTATSRCSTKISADRSTVTFQTVDESNILSYDLEDLDTETLLETSSGLRPGENLTFDLAFFPSTFLIKQPKPNYLAIGSLVALGLLFVASIFSWLKCAEKQKEKKSLASASKPVQYLPPKDLTVAESAKVYLDGARNPQVATLMELAVSHKIELERGKKKTFGGYHWKIHIKSVDGLSAEQNIVLEILNGGSIVHAGDTIEVKRHSATSHLEKLGRDFNKKIEGNLRGKQLFEPKGSQRAMSGASVALLVTYIATSLISWFVIADTILADDVSVMFRTVYLVSVPISFFAYLISYIAVSTSLKKYTTRTRQGIATSNYLEGLREYISLAEADRLKFLHSVKGADVSNTGIVKLYEKLLPYAIIFGVEDSWMKEMNKYYEMNDVSEPTWVLGATYLSVSDFRTFSNFAQSTISSSTAVSSSGSSGFSGGGGGGFSGGGGGGGGGGGW